MPLQLPPNLCEWVYELFHQFSIHRGFLGAPVRHRISLGLKYDKYDYKHQRLPVIKAAMLMKGKHAFRNPPSHLLHRDATRKLWDLKQVLFGTFGSLKPTFFSLFEVFIVGPEPDLPHICQEWWTAPPPPPRPRHILVLLLAVRGTGGAFTYFLNLLYPRMALLLFSKDLGWI